MARRLLPLLVLATVNLMGAVSFAAQIDGRLAALTVLFSGGPPPSLDDHGDARGGPEAVGDATALPAAPTPEPVAPGDLDPQSAEDWTPATEAPADGADPTPDESPDVVEPPAPPDEDLQRDFGPFYDLAEAVAVARDWEDYGFVVDICQDDDGGQDGPHAWIVHVERSAGPDAGRPPDFPDDDPAPADPAPPPPGGP